MWSILLWLTIYALAAWPTYLACVALSKRVEDTWARQAFIFSFSTAWPLTWVLVICILLLILLALLWLAVTWPLRRAPS